MALTKGRKKRIMGVIAAMLAFALLAVALNASWVQDILNPIPPEELAEIEKAFNESYMVLNANIVEVITFTPEEREAMQAFFMEKEVESPEFSKLILISSATNYSYLMRNHVSAQPNPAAILVEAGEKCSQEFFEGKYILYLMGENKSEQFIPWHKLPERVGQKLKSFLEQYPQYQGKENIGTGYQMYLPACSRSGPVRERYVDYRFGQRRLDAYEPPKERYWSEPNRF